MVADPIYATAPPVELARLAPELPFDDRTFDLVLSSHLLFSYPRR
jgi:hypothetical protein